MEALTKKEARAIVKYVVKLEERLDKFGLQYPTKGMAASKSIEKLIKFVYNP